MYKKNNCIVEERIDNEVILFCESSGKLYVLGRIEALIWDNLDDSTIENIVLLVTQQFDVESEIAKKDVLCYIEQLKSLNLIDSIA